MTRKQLRAEPIAFSRRSLIGILRAAGLGAIAPEYLPIQQPSTLELGLNLKTAKELGIAIPQSMLLLGDTVIQ
jgi:putative ABC transport system substrate-binding protein